MERIYLIKIDDVNAYLDSNNRPEDSTVEFIMGADEDTCKMLVQNSTDKNVAVFTPKEFEAEVNYDIFNIYNSDQYFIKIF
jgi:hypothetical protein